MKQTTCNQCHLPLAECLRRNLCEAAVPLNDARWEARDSLQSLEDERGFTGRFENWIDVPDMGFLVLLGITVPDECIGQSRLDPRSTEAAVKECNEIAEAMIFKTIREREFMKLCREIASEVGDGRAPE